MSCSRWCAVISLALAVVLVGRPASAGPAAPQTYTVNKTVDTDDGSCDATDCTLREAILAANLNSPAADTIDFSLPVGSIIGLDASLPQITESLTIAGPGSVLLTIDANGVVGIWSAGKGEVFSEVRRLFDLTGVGDLDFSISGVTLTGAVGQYYAGSVIMRDLPGSGGSVTLNDVVVLDNYVYGGAFDGVVYVQEASLTATDCLFMGNIAGNGPAITAGGTTVLNDTDFIENSISEGAGGTGGAVQFGAGGPDVSLTVNGGLFARNSSFSSGGALWIYSAGGTALLRGVTIASNYTHGFGGGIDYYTETGMLTIEDSVIEQNTAEFQYGGGIIMRDGSAGSLLVRGSIFRANYTGGSGGGVAVLRTDGLSPGEIEIIDSTLVDNSATSGGGVYVYSTSVDSGEILNTTISGNTALDDGGGIYLDNSGGGMLLRHNTITSNTADSDNDGTGDGGGIFSGADAVPTRLSNSVVWDNHDSSVAPGFAGKAYEVYPDCAGTFVSEGVNLIGDATGCMGLSAGDLIGADADLGPLTPVPATVIAVHDPGLMSAAIDAAGPTECAATDAIGQLRNPNACDIGAVESVAFRLFLAAAADDGCTLQASGGGVASSMTLLVLAVAGAFAFERRRRRG